MTIKNIFRCHIINDQNNGQYQENSTIKFKTEIIKQNLCDYADKYVLVTGNVKIINGNNNTRFCFKNSPFTRPVVHLNDVHIETAENLQLVINHYKLIEYSDNYQDSRFFVSFLVPLFYDSSFFRSAELIFLNTKINLELSWTPNCIMSNVGGNSTFQVTKSEFHVPVVTLNTDDNLKLTKLLGKGFKRLIFWNEYKSKAETHILDNNNPKIILLDNSFQGVNRLFFLAYVNGGVNQINMDSHRRYDLSRVYLTKFIVLIDGKNFYYQPISDEIKKYDELIKSCTGKGQDYTTECLVDYKYYKNHYLKTACNLSKQKELDSDPKSIQQIEIVFMLNTNAQILTILEKSKETILEFYKGTTKVL